MSWSRRPPRISTSAPAAGCSGSTSRRSVSRCEPARASAPTARSTSYLTKSKRIPGNELHGRGRGPGTARSDRAAPARLLAAPIAALLFSGLLGAALAVGAPGAPPDEEGVRAAVEQANAPAVWGEALRRGDPAPLASVWADDPLAYF